jgi:hypothetical protein
LRLALGFPPVTPEGVKRLAAQLDKDLAKVMASGASAALKQQIHDQVGKIKDVLLGPAATDSVNVGSWVLFLAPQFKQLTANLQQALPLGPMETGACFYTNPDGCIQSTSDQCTELGGSFQPGGTCP